MTASKTTPRTSASRRPGARTAAKTKAATKRPSNTRFLSSENEPFEHLAEVRLWSQKNSLDGPVPIFANVKLGPITIDAGGRHYKMFVRRAFLQLRCRDFRKTGASADYKRALTKEEAQAHVERIMREESGSGWKAKVGARFGLSKVEAGGELTAGRKRDSTSSTTTKSALELMLIQTLPNLRWRLGDEQLGDIRKMQGFLEGDYFFHDCPEKLPLCELEAVGEMQGGHVTAILTVSLKDGVHIVRDGDYASARSIPEDERESFASAFTDRLRALCLARFCEGSAMALAKGQLSVRESDDA